MKNSILSQVKGSIIASGIASILLGLLFWFNPVLFGLSIGYFAGIVFVAVGIAKVVFSFASPEGVAGSIIGGVVFFLLGLLCLFRPDVIADLLTIMAGIYVIVDASTILSQGIYAAKAKIPGGIPVIIFSILFMICGFYVMFAPFSFIMQVAGIVMVLDGIFNLVFVAVMSKNLK